MAVEMFDPVFAPGAQALRSNAQAFADAFAPELLVWIEEIPAGLFLTGLGRIVVGIVAGLIALGGSTTLTGRDQAAVQHMAAHLLTHPNSAGLFGLTAASVATPQALAAELQALRQGVAAQNLDLVRAAFAFSPTDVTSYFQSVGSQFQALFAPGAAGLAGAPPSIAAAVPPGPEIAAAVQAAVGYGEVF